MSQNFDINAVIHFEIARPSVRNYRASFCFYRQFVREC